MGVRLEVHQHIDVAVGSEVESARNLLKGNRVLALESMQSRAELIGSETLMRGAVTPMEEIIARIDAVTPERLHALAHTRAGDIRLRPARRLPPRQRHRCAGGLRA